MLLFFVFEVRLHLYSDNNTSEVVYIKWHQSLYRNYDVANSAYDRTNHQVLCLARTLTH
jgi:hypothetical protein